MQHEPIAIIGMAGIFPKAENLDQYWDNILQAIDCITDIPNTHWSVDNYYDSDPKAEDKTYCKRGGFVPSINFNPMEFGLPPNILENIDVAQLLALVVAKQALKDASYADTNPYANSTGVTLGVSALSSLTGLTSRLQYPIWERVLENAGIPPSQRQKIIEQIKLAYAPWREDSFPGYLSNVVAGRIANRLNLGGVNCSVDAACASSMAALQMAIDELTLKRSDMMITGGVDLNNGASAFISFSKTPAFTRHTSMRPFDNDSDGMLIGEGIGMMVLRRLSDAERDGNRVYAIIRGIGASSDGKHKSIYAPSEQGQALALKRAYSNAGISPNTIGLVEAHGTGTATGDPAEFAALHAVFGEYNIAPNSIALGSVKSQIGHTKVAAGVAGMIKAALALYHKILPPTINVNQPNAKFNIEQSAFYLNTTARPWFSSNQRRAGVSAFGFGGTNFHAVLEEHEISAERNLGTRNTTYQIILQANSSNQLLELCIAKRAQLLNDSTQSLFSELLLSSIETSIASDSARIGFLIDNVQQLLELLDTAVEKLLENPAAEAFQVTGKIYYRAKGWDPKYKIVALFSGQGSQYLEMGKTLCWHYPIVNETYSAMDQVLAMHHKEPITGIIFPKPTLDENEKNKQSDALRRTENTQAAIGSFNLGLFKLLKSMGFSADMVAGHSLGELSALHAAEVINEKDYLELLYQRGQAMILAGSSINKSGTMLAINGDINRIEALIQQYPKVYIANRNSNTQLVIAGAMEDIEQIRLVFAQHNIQAIPLSVNGAFHTKFVEHAQKPFAKALQQVTFHAPKIPVYANTSGKPYPNTVPKIREMLAQHITHPVNFKQEIEQLYSDGARIFVEFGPGNVLTKLVDNILNKQEHSAIAVNANKHQDSNRLLQEAILQMRIVGLPLQTKEKVSLPKPIVQKTNMHVELCGASYISDKTKQAFEAALMEENIELTIHEEEEMSQTSGQPKLHQHNGTQNNEDVPIAHQQYLKNMADHSLQFFQLVQQQYLLLNNPNASPAVLQSFERSIALFHEQQNLMQSIHEQYLISLESHERVGRSSIKPITSTSLSAISTQVTEAPLQNKFEKKETLNASQGMQSLEAMLNVQTQNTVVASPAVTSSLTKTKPISNSQDTTVDDIAKILLSVVSEKTGYSIDMLDLTMDLNADLGIDSIKRVEILGALEGKISGDFTGLNFEKFAELRTLEQIAQYLGEAKKKTLA